MPPMSIKNDVPCTSQAYQTISHIPPMSIKNDFPYTSQIYQFPIHLADLSKPFPRAISRISRRTVRIDRLHPTDVWNTHKPHVQWSHALSRWNVVWKILLLWCRSVFIARVMHLPPRAAGGDDETRSSLCTTLLAGAEELAGHALHFLTDGGPIAARRPRFATSLLLILWHR
jgi:hypothetical protein